MRSSPSQTAVPLFNRMQDYSSVPAKVRKAGARNGGQEPAPDLIRGRPPGWRGRASSWAAASMPVRWRLFARIACLVAIVLSSSAWGIKTVHAKSASAMHNARWSAADPFANFITEASQRFGISARWIRAVMHVESAGRPHTVSPKGAMGLMQIMPKTWTELRGRYGFGSDPYDPRDNILAGAAYLRELHDRYGAPGFLAAYNAGPGRYDRHLATGRTLPDETKDYVAKLVPMTEGEHVGRQTMVATNAPTWRRASMFVVRGDGNSAGGRLSSYMHTVRAPNIRPIVDLSALVPQSPGLFVHRAREARSQ